MNALEPLLADTALQIQTGGQTSFSLFRQPENLNTVTTRDEGSRPPALGRCNNHLAGAGPSLFKPSQPSRRMNKHKRDCIYSRPPCLPVLPPADDSTSARCVFLPPLLCCNISSVLPPSRLIPWPRFYSIQYHTRNPSYGERVSYRIESNTTCYIFSNDASRSSPSSPIWIKVSYSIAAVSRLALVRCYSHSARIYAATPP